MTKDITIKANDKSVMTFSCDYCDGFAPKKSDYKKATIIAQIGIALHREALNLDTGMKMLDTEYACEVLEMLSCNEDVQIAVGIE
jgi:hypothetical protein